MDIHAGKTQVNNSQSVANAHSQKQGDSEATDLFVDNRPEAIAQRKLQEAINNSPRVQQLKPYQAMVNNSPQVKQLKDYQAMASDFTSQTAQRKESSAEETVQGRFEPIQKKENNTGLPDNLKSGIENLSGHSMDAVKVHYNSDKPAGLNAHAYAQGTDIHLGAGQEKHLPHEAWHVVQQAQGRVKPTMQMKDTAINDDAALESEADQMGQQAITQRRENTNAVAWSRPSQVTQLAGAYEGRMAKHDTYGDSYTMDGKKKSEFTYHHVIPENKILLVLDKIAEVVDKDDQVKNLKEGIANHAKAQFDEAMVKDTAFYLTNEIKNYNTAPPITVEADEARKIITAEHTDRGALITAFQDMLGAKLGKLEATTDEAVLTERKDLAAKFKEKAFEELIAKNAISGIDDKFEEGAIWMPGNIHRGPKGSYRLDPKNNKQFKEWQDDGGDSFEKAAANLVSVDHFAKLWALNAEMDKMIGMDVPEKSEEEKVKAFRDQAAAVLTLMDQIRKLGMTQFDESQWESNKVKGGKGIKSEFMRLKEHVPKEGEEKRLEEAKKLR
jgi:hypothetical protein